MLRNPKESAALDVYKSHLREMEANLPDEEKYKNFKRGFESPISVVDQIHAGGDSNHGIPERSPSTCPTTRACARPRAPRRSSCRTCWARNTTASCSRWRAWCWSRQDAANVNKRYMYMETLFHELSHSLGPGSIMVNGRKTTVDKELKDVGSGFEEAKADVMGAYNVLFMMDKGVLPAADKPQIRAAYVAGLFRAMRFGDTDAHGRGAAMQYRYLRDKGGIVWDASAKRFRIDPAKLDAGIRDLVGDIVRLQATGDYAGTKAFLAKWAVMDAEAKEVTGKMGHIPVDIHPIYPDHV